MSEPAPAITLTDPKPIPADARCPRCGAGPEARVASAGFGEPHPVCSKCGYEFVGGRCE